MIRSPKQDKRGLKIRRLFRLLADCPCKFVKCPRKLKNYMLKNYLVIHRKAKTHVGEGFQNLFIVQAQTHDEAAKKTRPEALFGLLVTTIEVDGEPWQYYNAVRDARERDMMP